MLPSPAPYPYVGSFALLEHEGELTLARIVMRRGTDDGGTEAVVSLPLRDGASGNLRVDFRQLIDATPLHAAEEREFHDLDRHLAGRDRFRTPKQKADKIRRDALHSRILHAALMDRIIRDNAERLAAIGLITPSLLRAA